MFSFVKATDVAESGYDETIAIGGVTCFVAYNAMTSKAAFESAVNGQILVYELATPIEIDVSELSVDTIVGVNNIVSDCGGDITVEYEVGEMASDIEKIIKNNLPWIDIVGTLTAGSTSITLSSSAITTNSTVEVFTNPEVPYNDITITTGQAVVTFDAQQSNIFVKVRIS